MFQPKDPYGNPDNSDEAKMGAGLWVILIGAFASFLLANPLPIIAAIAYIVIKGW